MEVLQSKMDRIRAMVMLAKEKKQKKIKVSQNKSFMIHNR